MKTQLLFYKLFITYFRKIVNQCVVAA